MILSGASNAHLLVSIHCNSAGDASDPVALRGVSVYYRSIGFKPLADIMYDKMLALGLKPFGEIRGLQFHTQLSYAAAECISGNSVSFNPDDEILLLDDGFRKKVAEQIASGLEEYVKINGKTAEK